MKKKNNLIEMCYLIWYIYRIYLHGIDGYPWSVVDKSLFINLAFLIFLEENKLTSTLYIYAKFYPKCEKLKQLRCYLLLYNLGEKK